MKILHLISYYVRATKTGGPALLLSQSAQALQKAGLTNQIITTTGNLDEEIALDFKGDVLDTVEEGVPTVYLRRKKSIFPPTYYYTPQLQDWLSAHLNEYDVVIIHGVWTYFSLIGAKACQKKKIPYLYFIYGSFDPWAMNHHGVKKSIYWNLVEKTNIKKASGILVSSNSEANQVQKLKIDKSIFVARNGYLYPLPQIDEADSILKIHIPEIGRHAFICSISRLHPKKGLEVLIQAWGRISSDFPDWKLIIAGPDEGGYLAKLELLVGKNNLKNSVLFPGLVQGEFKTALLQKAALFVLPSFSEGVPGSVTEALAYGIPVLITPYCHLPEVVEAQAGLIVEPEIEIISDGLKYLMSNEGLRKQMGINAQKLARDQFDEIKIAADLVSYLRKLLVQ